MKTLHKTRKIIHMNGGEPFEVAQHIITRHGWEYYLGETDSEGIAYGFVMGFADEWGSVYLPEIEPYILSIQRGEELYELFPPIDYKWEDD